jgi:DedD protein
MRQMDQHLKERLVGAAVLVVIGVLVIPVLLDGPPPDEPVRVGLELPAAGNDRKSHTIRLDVPAERPATPGSGSIVRPDQPAAGKNEGAPQPDVSASGHESEETSVPAAKSEEPEPTPARPEPKRAEPPEQNAGDGSPPAQRPTAEPEQSGDPSSSGGWVVQLGSFSSEENAVRLSGEIRRQGYPVFVSKVTAGGKTMHRVRVGPVAEKDEAQTLAQRLKTSGHAGRVMANGD